MKGVISTVCIRAVVPLISLALLLQWPAYAAAQSIDREAIREPIWTANKQTVVKLKVSGRDASGAPVVVRTGSGVIVRSNGVIVTALHVVGDDSDWFELPGGGRDRKIEVIGLDEHGIERPLGDASVRPIPGRDLAILHIVGERLPTATISDRSSTDITSVVAILWDPDSKQPEPVYGDLVKTDTSKYTDKLTVRLAVKSGHSGSGLFGTDKKLIGIVTDQLDSQRALALPVYAFSPFLPPIASVKPQLKSNLIAILPFRNLDKDKSLDHLSLKIPVALSQRLSDLLSGSMHLMPQRSCAKFADCSASDLAKDLGLAFVVDGNYEQLSDGRLRITVNLLDTTRDWQVWSHEFDLLRSDILNPVVGPMVTQIAAVLRLPWDKAARGDAAGTQNTEAYEIYLEGLASGLVLKKENYNAAIRSFKRAITLDTSFAQAHAALAEAYATSYDWNLSDDSSVIKEAERSARRALALNSNLPEAHYALAYSLETQGKRQDAVREYFAAIRLNPDYVPALSSVARYLFYMGAFDSALAKLETIAKLDPTVNVHVRRAMCFYFSGRPQESLQDARQAENKARDARDLTLIGFTYVWLKDLDSAERVLDRLKKDEPNATINISELQAWLHTARGEFSQAREEMEIIAKRRDFGIYDEIATLYAIQGEAEKSIEWLEKAVKLGAPNYTWYRSDFYKVLRGNPRYEAILNELSDEYSEISKEYETLKHDASSR